MVRLIWYVPKRELVTCNGSDGKYTKLQAICEGEVDHTWLGHTWCVGPVIRRLHPFDGLDPQQLQSLLERVSRGRG